MVTYHRVCNMVWEISINRLDRLISMSKLAAFNYSSPTRRYMRPALFKFGLLLPLNLNLQLLTPLEIFPTPIIHLISCLHYCLK